MIIHNKGIPSFAVPVKVTCMDDIMIEMLACVPDTPTLGLNETTLLNIRNRDKRGDKIIYVFLSGATLAYGCDGKTNEYEINHYAFNSGDGLAAIEELKMLECLRKARKHFSKMKTAFASAAMQHYSIRVIKC